MEPFIASQQNKKLVFLHFLKVGFLEIGFIVILLFILFFTLNYFKIINFNALLSLLPSESQLSNQKVPNKLPLTEAESAQKAIASYMHQEIKDAYLPQVSTLVASVSAPQKFYTLQWTNSELSTRIRGDLIFDDKNKPLQLDTRVVLNNQHIISTKADIDTATKYLKKYYKNPNIEGLWKCQVTRTDTSVCEVTPYTKTKQEAYGLLVYQSTSINFNLVLFSCTVAPNAILPETTGIYHCLLF